MFSQLTDLDLRLIRVFLAIVDAGGVSSAQATLNVGQSTISTQLATLETRLGYRLCERGRGGFRLSARGEQFVDAARALLDAVDSFGIEARNVGRKLVGTLDIGMIGHTPVSASARISDAIGRFRSRDQSVRFSILVRSPGELEELLLNGRIQIGIGYFWHRVPSLEYTEIFAEEQFAYCAKGHPLFERAGRVTPAQAAAHEWAWRSYPLPEAENAAPARNVTAVADNMEAVAMLVLSGHHLGYLPEHFAAPFVEQGLLAALNPALMRYRVTFHMVTRARRQRTDIVEAFLDDMKAAHASNLRQQN
ncbi:LysR family transcriptional regulator [bacterium M00.F.Ca.ET.228.01.1.1]|uniref:LysR family transcriptional regulator n=1 Tax=Paraburkholderia phenoliruptrix TaxID=252970 RepID=UPI001092B7E2|nr:LysR family transcriptional regulator [Paraburkholderia phenoliruptrix]TGP43241.1 LysR family transcriptional regulator [bacterium M00.F.Ca.ET.228.01.1.1]TGS00680.1 LysR family transcriptional regulator [bacterium M00.F.Ca.ET.191.01.1.1]TGU05066.1 LysR family transcriptional regulator [bacterium M00.F.Ca.ET.155.01.1.1]MBW0446821.1 LysR family transcriptional regulator [Paraburkholderia phenoliruptrix]MBW9099317.1 LysR family transcriptional regulator [Paraburkholderia phenoliruptrix]